MKNTTVINDFKDLKKAIEEVTKKQPAKSRYAQQAQKMGYTKDKSVVLEQKLNEATAFEIMQDIVKTKGAKKIEGTMVDMFTASVVVKAYAKVNDANKKKIENAKLNVLIGLAHKVMGLKAHNEFDKEPLKGFPYNELFSKEEMSDLNSVRARIKQADLHKEGIEITEAVKLEIQRLVEEGKWPMPSSTKEKKAFDALYKKMHGGPEHKAIKRKIQNPIKADDAFHSLVMKKVMGEETLQEGVWAVPDTISKIKELQKALSKPLLVKTEKEEKKAQKLFGNLVGNDWVWDEWYKMTLEYDDVKKVGDARIPVVQWMNEWGFKLSGFKITHAPEAYMKEALDPVGKGDDDIDNDGDSDDADKYLKKRRAAITKSVKNEVKRPRGNIKKPKGKMLPFKEETLVTKTPFKLKSKSYPRAVGIATEGYGTRHAKREDILEACDSFGMITDEELQVEQLQKTLGKSGFLTYNISELTDIFDERETQRMILALESVTAEEPLDAIDYSRAQIDEALETETEIEFVKPDGMKAAGPILKMCENTYNIKDKHTGKSFTFKYIEEEEVKTFNQVISEAKFPKKLVRMAGGIAFDKRYVGGNMTGAVKAIEKIKKGLSDDPEVERMLRLANETFNNEFYNALSEKEQSEYQKFFASVLKKFGVSSPAELSGDKEKEFYNYIDKNWDGKKETDEWIAKDGTRRRVKEGDKRKPVKEDELDLSRVKIDARRTNFREKMRKLGYIKGK